MHIEPNSRSTGWMVDRLVRTYGKRYHSGYREDRLWLVGWEGDDKNGTSGGTPIWSERQPDAPVLFHRDVVDEIERRGVSGKLYAEQPFWYEDKYGSEGEAMRDIRGLQAP